jgi:bacterioferritin (cytochrome b1)
MAESRKDRETDTDNDTGATVGGAFAGGAVGAIAGAVGGKAIASRINPQAEEEHWRSNYSSRPYVASKDVVEDQNKLLRGELAATETYRQALDKIRDEFGRDARFQQLAQLHKEHDQAAAELRSLIQQMGGTPSDDSGAWGAWSNTVMGAARIFGDKSALSALLSGERSGVDDYQDALKQERTPDQLRHVYRSHLARNQEHVQQLETLIDAT